MSKYTPWFPAHIRPAYPGVYEVRWPPGVWYRRWDGARWYGGSFNKAHAAESEDTPALERPWRGLAEPPKGWTK